EGPDQAMHDIHVKIKGKVTNHMPDTTINVRPGRLAGLQIDDLATQLAGAKSGETREVKVTVPDTYPVENVRGKEVTLEVAIKDIKKLEPIEINDEFLQSLGFSKEQ